MSIGTICGILVLIILTISVFAGLKKFKDGKDAEKFLDDLTDKILAVTLETINDMSAEGFTDFADFNQNLIINVYNATWDFVRFTAEEAEEVNEITKAVLKLIDKNTVEKFVNNLIEEEKITDKVYNKFASDKIQVLLDQNEVEETYDENEYFTDEVVNPEDLEPAKEKEYTEAELEEIAKLIPPTDEENEFVDLEDDSVEILVDKKEILAQKASNGQMRYYEIDQDGKKTRVTKEYAMQHMEGWNMNDGQIKLDNVDRRVNIVIPTKTIQSFKSYADSEFEKKRKEKKKAIIDQINRVNNSQAY